MGEAYNWVVSICLNAEPLNVWKRHDVFCRLERQPREWGGKSFARLGMRGVEQQTKITDAGFWMKRKDFVAAGSTHVISPASISLRMRWFTASLPSKALGLRLIANRADFYLNGSGTEWVSNQWNLNCRLWPWSRSRSPDFHTGPAWNETVASWSLLGED